MATDCALVTFGCFPSVAHGFAMSTRLRPTHRAEQNKEKKAGSSSKFLFVVEQRLFYVALRNASTRFLFSPRLQFETESDQSHDILWDPFDAL